MKIYKRKEKYAGLRYVGLSIIPFIIFGDKKIMKIHENGKLSFLTRNSDKPSWRFEEITLLEFLSICPKIRINEFIYEEFKELLNVVDKHLEMIE